MPKITKKFIESIQLDPKKTLVYWDHELKGFGVVVLPSGRKTYCVQYRNADRIKKRLKIGIHGQITAEEARTLAKKYFSNITHGEDPAKIKKDNKNLPTIQDLFRDYVERHGPRKRLNNLQDDKYMFSKYISPAFGNNKVAFLSRKEIEALHLKMNKTPYHANRVLSLLSKMLSLSVAWGMRDDNPVKGIERYPEEKRDRWLDNDEVQRLWDVLNKYKNQDVANAIRLLLLTGSRRNEVLHATWDQFDLDSSMWTKPAHTTKQKRMEHVPLSVQAVSILKVMKSKSNSPFLFPGKIPTKPVQGIKKAWHTIREKAELTDVRLHDLRHTYASHLVSNGLSLSIIGKLLGHTQVSTTQRYAHLADEPLRNATAFFGNKVAQLISKELIE